MFFQLLLGHTVWQLSCVSAGLVYKPLVSIVPFSIPSQFKWHANLERSLTLGGSCQTSHMVMFGGGQKSKEVAMPFKWKDFKSFFLAFWVVGLSSSQTSQGKVMSSRLSRKVIKSAYVHFVNNQVNFASLVLVDREISTWRLSTGESLNLWFLKKTKLYLMLANLSYWLLGLPF